MVVAMQSNCKHWHILITLLTEPSPIASMGQFVFVEMSLCMSLIPDFDF